MAHRRLRIGFLMDPLPRIDIDKDTTFVFMLEAQERKHEIFFLEGRDLVLRGRLRRRGSFPSRCDARRGDHFELGSARVEPLEALDVLLLRKDPPFDMDFFFDTHVASLVDEAKTLVINSPRGLRDANEKLYALHFPDVIPRAWWRATWSC
jgi:glutathione synthase